ncbi:MAG TPA: contractile injection system protein, VgrG/Pvc8 family [Candidatus Acidoferrales bacterium]|nr:contractile injection system protein, VgrG/Pvc8 family [Candidatus Acidoferrales bacterium]
MTATIPIYEVNDFYAPAFSLKIRSAEFPEVVARDVISVTYKDSIDELDTVDLVLNNWDDTSTAPTNFIYAVDDYAPYADLFTFDQNTFYDVAMGYQNVGLVTMLNGTLKSLEPHYPAGGAPSLSVRLVNRLELLKDQQKTKTWTNVSTADIAQAIARDHNLQIVVSTHKNDDDQPQPYVLQQNQYDFVFLMQRARRIGYQIWLQDPQTLYFGPSTPGDGGGTITYKLGFHTSMMDFSPQFSMSDQVGTVKVTARDQTSKSTFSGQATRADVGLNPDLEQFVTATIAQKVKSVSNQPLHCNGLAQQLAREIMRNLMEKMLTATVNCPGLPAIRAGTMIEIDNVGSRFSGPYFVTSSTHTIDDGGYRTSFTARREKYG